MPELPEVESIKLQLAKYLKGHTITSVEIRSPKFEINSKLILGSSVIGTRRFGKVTVIDLSNGYSILVHVKLTGQFVYRGPNLPNPKTLSKKVIGGIPGPHTLVIFNLDRGGKLYYNDVRRFGWIRIVKSDEIEKEKFISKLGKDALLISLTDFQDILSKTSRAIKIVLMDQTKIGGVGNIYANDALWLSKINPKTPAKSLEPKKVHELYNAIIHVLKEGIKYGGASELSFITPDGTEGRYQNHTLVYGREGLPCLRCEAKPSFAKASKGTVEKYFLGGRGTYWCPVCQGENKQINKCHK